MKDKPGNAEFCRKDSDMELISFRTAISSPLRGEYKIDVTHAGNCMKGKTNFMVTVLINGDYFTERRGVSNKMNGEVVMSFKFTY